MLRHLFAFLAPHTCLSCGQEGSLLCPDCLGLVSVPVPSGCFKCRRPTTDYVICDSCRPASHLNHVWIGVAYTGFLQAAFQRYKFERAQDLAPVLAEVMHKNLPALPSDLLITYVPTATSHVRERGFDQAKLLAKAFARQRHLAITPLLYRLGQLHQVGADRQTRVIQMKGTFRPRQLERIKGARILLIDDIVTTGSTLEAAAETLRTAGATSVDAAALAQKQ